MDCHIHGVVRQGQSIVQDTRRRRIHGSTDVVQVRDDIETLAVNEMDGRQIIGGVIGGQGGITIVQEVLRGSNGQVTRASKEVELQGGSTTIAARVARSVCFGTLGTCHGQWLDYVGGGKLIGAGTGKGTLIVERIKRQWKFK
jgi:hypothetical protein